MGLLLTAPCIVLRGFKRAYRRRGLYPRGLFTGNKKKRFKISQSSHDKNIHALHLLVFKSFTHHNKLHKFQYKLEGIYFRGLILKCAFFYYKGNGPSPITAGL